MPRPDIQFIVQVDSTTPRARRRHSKSRNGCDGCKRRRVKCDERRPRCGACARKHEHCSYERSSPPPPPPTEPATVPEPASPTSSPPGRRIDLLQMRLFHHFEAHTRFSLVFGPAVWRECMVLALDNEFLMHAILMISAVHMRRGGQSGRIDAQELRTAELEHQACASLGLRRTLRGRGIGPGNLDPVFAVCFLLFNLAWASFEQDECAAGTGTGMGTGTNTGTESDLPSIDADFLVYLGAGTRNLMRQPTFNGDLLQSPLFCSVVAFSPRVELLKFLHDGGAGSTLPERFEADFRREYVGIWPAEADPSRLDTYLAECRRLILVLAALELDAGRLDGRTVARFLFTWPMMMSPAFVDLMRQGDAADCVALLFWHYYTTVQISAARTHMDCNGHDGWWWTRPRTDVMVTSLRARLRQSGIEPHTFLSSHLPD